MPNLPWLLLTCAETPANQGLEDGKELDFECDKTNIKGLVGECDRHSRQLQKAADLTD